MCGKKKLLVFFSLKVNYFQISLHFSTVFFFFYWNWIFFNPQTFSVLKRLPFNYIIPWPGVFLIICLNVIVWTSIDRSCSISGLAFAATQREFFLPFALRTLIRNIMLHLMEILLMKRFTTKNKLIFGNNQWYHPMHFLMSFTFPFSFSLSPVSWFSFVENGL